MATAPCIIRGSSVCLSRQAGAADLDEEHGLCCISDSTAGDVVKNETETTLSIGIIGEVVDDADNAACTIVIAGACFVMCKTTGTRDSLGAATTDGVITTTTKGHYTPATFLETGVTTTRCLALIHPGSPRIGTYA